MTRTVLLQHLKKSPIQIIAETPWILSGSTSGQMRTRVIQVRWRNSLFGWGVLGFFIQKKKTGAI